VDQAAFPSSPTDAACRLKEHCADLRSRAQALDNTGCMEEDIAAATGGCEKEEEEAASTARSESEADTSPGQPLQAAEADAETEAEVGELSASSVAKKFEEEGEESGGPAAARGASPAQAAANVQVTAGLPSVEALRGAAVPEAAFRQLCKWIRRTQRAGRLAEAGEELPEEHRRCVTRFLTTEVLQNPDCQLKGRAALRQLAALEPWCCLDTLDQEALQQALSGAQLLGQPRVAAWTGPGLPRVPSELKEAALQPETILPSQAALREAAAGSADRAELMEELCGWLAAARRRSTGGSSLAAEVAGLPREHRQAIVTFAVPGAHYEQAQSYAMRMLPSMSKRIALRRRAAGLSSQGRSKAAAQASSAQNITHEQFYVLQSLSEVADALFEGPEDPNLALLARAVARLPS